MIKILEQALNEARRGEIIAAAIVFARPNEDKCSGVSAAPGGDMHYLVAACDYLKRDIIAETDNSPALGDVLGFLRLRDLPLRSQTGPAFQRRTTMNIRSVCAAALLALGAAWVWSIAQARE